MSNQRELSLDNYLTKLRELKERLDKLIPPNKAALERLSHMPVEFDRRWWSSRVDVLIEKVKVDYQKYQAKAQEGDFYAKFMTVMLDVALEAGKMEPVPPPDSPRVGISISPSGKIEPDFIDDLQSPQGTVLVSLEDFEAIGRKIKGRISEGTITPKNEVEIPKLIHNYALSQKKN